MAYKIGSARADENYKYSGGKAGDQRQTSSKNDTRGEVSMQTFYVHKKGWYVITAKDAKIRKRIAAKMIAACNNKNIGYSQTDRYGIIKYGTNTKTRCNCDCSSLVRQCVREATGIDPGDFTTASEVAALYKTTLFDVEEYHDGMKLETGAILVTKTKGHTAAVVDGEPEEKKENKSYYPKYKGDSVSIVDALSNVGESDVSLKHRKQIAKANGIDGYKGTASQNSKLLSILKSGKLIRA